jgi:hypothetical protein
MSSESKFHNLLENGLIVLHGLILILVIGQNNIEIPAVIGVLGRMHPLMLHFPIVLLIMVGILFWFPKTISLANRNIFNSLFLISLVFTGLTALAGLFLSSEDGYLKEEFQAHQWTGLGVFWIGSLWYISLKLEKNILAKYSSYIAILLVFISGHLGASLTHGEDFLFSPLTLSSVQIQVNLEEALAYDHVIKPILEQKCISCHKASKQKGDLRLDGIKFILAGGKNGEVIDSLIPENSHLLKRIFLPLDDEEHMPPKGKPQLSEKEIEILEAWIIENADFDKKLISYPENSTFFTLAKDQFSLAEDKVYVFDYAPASAINSLNNEYRVIKAIYPDSPALRVSFFGQSQFDPKSIDEIKKIKEQVVDINLSNMPLEDTDISRLTGFNNLEKLNLNSTDINGSGLAQLENLKNLNSLSISGNRIDQDFLDEILSLVQLKNLYIWNTGLSDSDVNKLKTNLPNTHVETGFKDEGTLFQLNPPTVQSSTSIFNDRLEVTLKHPIGSVKIFYTLDNTRPDSINYKIYKEPIILEKNTTLRTRAFAEGWLGSEERSAVFFKAGIQPKEFKLSYPPHNSYKGKEVQTLFDLEKGDEDFGSGKWLGFQDQPFELNLELGRPRILNSIAFSILTAEASYIMPPAKVEIWTKDKNGNWNLIKTDNPNQPTQLRGRTMMLLEYSFGKDEIQSIRARLTPVNPLPKWHPGAGQKGWIFIDEVLIN